MVFCLELVEVRWARLWELHVIIFACRGDWGSLFGDWLCVGLRDFALLDSRRCGVRVWVSRGAPAPGVAG
jgi:hypothetical protein